MGDDTYTISGVRVGGRINNYGTVAKPPKVVDADDSSFREAQQPQQGGGYGHPPGAFSLAYSFVPYHRPPPPLYCQYQYPPPPSSYGQYQQYPPWQQYGGYGGGPPPQMPYYGGYGGYHGGAGYGHGQFPPPNQGGYYNNYGSAAATGGAPPPGYGHGQQDTVKDNKGLPPASGAPAAAANGAQAGQQGAAVHKQDQRDLGAVAAAAAATAVCTS